MNVSKTLWLNNPTFEEGDFLGALALAQGLDITPLTNRKALQTVVEGKSPPTPSNLRSSAVVVCKNFLLLHDPQLTWSSALPAQLAAVEGSLTQPHFKAFAEQTDFTGPWFVLMTKLVRAVSVEFIGQTKTDAGLGYCSPALLSWIIVQTALKL